MALNERIEMMVGNDSGLWFIRPNANKLFTLKHFNDHPKKTGKLILTPTKHTNTRVGINTKYRIKNPQTQMNDKRQDMNS